MQSQVNHSLCERKVGAGVVVADHVDVFGEATRAWTGFVPERAAESREKVIREGESQAFRTHAMMPCSNDTLALLGRFGNPLELRESAQGACEAMKMLENENSAERRQLVAWLAIYARQLALSRQGCRLLQKAIEVVNSADLSILCKQLEPHVLELAQSPHGNFVLAKMVERMPPTSINFVIERLQGNASKTAQNKYGCRVLERLIEHCSEEQLALLIRELVADADALSRHQFGNFVVQHLLEHGTSALRSSIAQQLLPCIAALAMHRNASHVVQKTLDFSDAAMQTEISACLLQEEHPNSLVEVACSRYGSFVVQQLSRIQCTRSRVCAHISGHVSVLHESQYGRRTLECFHLPHHNGDLSQASL
jgi:pumilio RNA-binding family